MDPCASVLIPCDLQEKKYLAHATAPGGSTEYGCSRCALSSYGLMDSQRIPYHFLRSPTHFYQYNVKHPECTPSQMSKDVGYNSFEYLHNQFNGILNLHPRLAVDINHDAKNKCEQLDACIKKDHLVVCLISLVYCEWSNNVL